MKKTLLMLLILSSLAFGVSDTVDKNIAENKESQSKTVCHNSKALDVQRSGCCSWHGGVAGCSSSGRVVCNDGTLSPTCTCAKPMPKPFG
ncbi:hypothetical protein [Sulfurimonas sp. NW15]|uniref:hypothetical protein n=1 Tax=unclassified Sulfurimonas TaxID=2623549 RepID=UPI003DA9EF72